MDRLRVAHYPRMGDQGVVRALTPVRPADGRQSPLVKPLVTFISDPSNQQTPSIQSDNASQKGVPVNRKPPVNGQIPLHDQRVHNSSGNRKSDKTSRTKSKRPVDPESRGRRLSKYSVPNSVTKAESESIGIQKDPVTNIDRQGTFVKDPDSSSLSGLEVPRITSASMPQRQVIRTDGNQQEREVVVSIVDRSGDSPDGQPVSVSESNFEKVKNSNNASNKSNNLTSNGMVSNKPVSENTSVNSKGKKNVNHSNNGGKTDMDAAEESKENHINTDSLHSNQGLERSFDKNTPFRLSNSNNIGDTTDSTKNSKPLPPKTPVPAEPVIHKKSDFVSQNKKKPGTDSPEKMTTYDSSNMVRTAALASDQTGTEDKPVSDDRIERLTAMLNQMSEKVAESEDRNKALTKANEELKEQAGRHTDAQNKTSTELQLLRNEWNELTKELENSRAERERIGEELASKANEDKDRLQTVTEENTKLDSELTQLKTDMKELIVTREKENTANEDIMKGLKVELTEARKNVGNVGSDYENQIKELKETIEKLTAENESLLQTVKELKAAKTALEATVKTCQMETEAVKVKLTNLNKENQELLDELNKVRSEASQLADYRKESDELGEEVEGLLKEKHALMEAIQQKDQIIEKQQNDIKSIDGLAHMLQLEQEQNAKLAKQVNGLTEESGTLRNEAKEKDKEVNDLRKKLSAASEKAETGKVALSSMTELIKEKQAHIEDLQKEVKTLADTNSNYLVAIEAFSSKNKRDDEVAKSKLEDIETSHRKLLDENKRLRTVLAHKNMSETSRNSESDDLLKILDKKDEELDRAKERIMHLEAMLDDVYKTREIQMMQTDGSHDEESKMSISSLPDIRQESRAMGYSTNSLQMRNPIKNKGRTTQSQESQWANYVESDQVSRNLRNYRDAQGYAQRYERRPNKRQKAGTVTKLK